MNRLGSATYAGHQPAADRVADRLELAPADGHGRPGWANYRVDVDALLEQTGSVDRSGASR